MEGSMMAKEEPAWQRIFATKRAADTAIITDRLGFGTPRNKYISKKYQGAWRVFFKRRYV
jgi:hypothetical protein